MIRSKSKRWQLQEAKAKFSEVFEKAFTDGPQVITRRNKQAVVMLPESEYQQLTKPAKKAGRNSLAILLSCPKGPELRIHRDPRDNVLRLPRVFDQE